jgi:malonyl-CoA O-methyltransferase
MGDFIQGPDSAHLLDKRQVRASFDRAAESYESVAVLQREVGQRLLERLELIRIAPQTTLDAGTGTGELGLQLARRYTGAHTVQLDLAPAMLAIARRRGSLLERWRMRRSFVCGDAERLPLATNSVDLIVSNLMLQWCNDLDAVLLEFRRILRPEGLLMFTTFGPDTLRELRAAWRSVDSRVHVNAFIDMHDIGDALLRTGFADPVMDREDMVLTYADARTLMRELKLLGAHNVTGGRPRGLTGRGRLQGMLAAYEGFRLSDGHLPATYEVVHGHCWAPAAGAQSRHQPGGEVHVPISRISRRGDAD